MLLALQRRQRARTRVGRPDGAASGGRGVLLGVEAVDARTQLPVFVPQFPVRLGQPFEPLGEPPRLGERGERPRATAAPVSSH